MELEQQILTQNECYQEKRPLKPKGVMVHSTGVAQPDPMVFVRRWNGPDVAGLARWNRNQRAQRQRHPSGVRVL